MTLQYRVRTLKQVVNATYTYRYDHVTQTPGSGERALASARLLLDSGAAYEFRTTVHPALLNADDLRRLARELAELGARHNVMQECVTSRCRDPELITNAPWRLTDKDLLREIGAQFAKFSRRDF